MKHNTLLFVFSFFIITTGIAQSEGFDARIIGGISAAQIRGDDAAGFDKVGIEAGIGASYALKYNLDAGIELLYSQRGSRSDESFSSTGDRQIYKLNYLSIPLTVTVRDWLRDEAGELSYYRVFAQGGFSYGRLLSADIEGPFGSLPVDEFIDALNENDISWLVGLGYQFNYHLGVRFRYNRSITKLFNAADNPSINYRDLLPFHLSLQLTYKL